LRLQADVKVRLYKRCSRSCSSAGRRSTCY